jgi:hypothetical protein
MSQPPWASQEGFDYGDSSWSLYSMYCKIAQEDDNRITKRCQKDVEGMLVFVSLRIDVHVTANKLENADWFIRCHHRRIAYGLYPGPQTKPARYVRFLLGEHLSTFRQLKSL